MVDWIPPSTNCLGRRKKRRKTKKKTFGPAGWFAMTGLNCRVFLFIFSSPPPPPPVLLLLLLLLFLFEIKLLWALWSRARCVHPRRLQNKTNFRWLMNRFRRLAIETASPAEELLACVAWWLQRASGVPIFLCFFFLKPKPPPVPTKSTCVRGIIPEPGPGPDQSIIIDLRARPSPIAHLPSSPRSLPNETKKLTDCPSGCRLRATELQMGRPIPVKNGPRRLGGIWEMVGPVWIRVEFRRFFQLRWCVWFHRLLLHRWLCFELRIGRWAVGC